MATLLARKMVIYAGTNLDHDRMAAVSLRTKTTSAHASPVMPTSTYNGQEFVSQGLHGRSLEIDPELGT